MAQLGRDRCRGRGFPAGLPRPAPAGPAGAGLPRARLEQAAFDVGRGALTVRAPPEPAEPGVHRAVVLRAELLTELLLDRHGAVAVRSGRRRGNRQLWTLPITALGLRDSTSAGPVRRA